MPEVLDQLATLADTTRSRLLLVLERHELAVSELCAVLQLPQSTVSRHLRILGDDGWVSSRADGTSRQYRLAAPLPEPAARLWAVVRDQMAGGVQAGHDAARLRSVLAERRVQSRRFFSTAAGQWDAMRTELFGARAELAAFPALLGESAVVADLGCGTGQLAAALAPFVGRVVAVDESRAMLDAARRRLEGHANIELRQGDLERLPIDDRSVDVALVVLALHHVVEPERVLAEARRVLAARGRLLLVDMVPHERDEYRQQMGHVWQGFSAGQIAGWLERAGFATWRYTPLPADPAARGPNLFAATASVAAG
jgi:ArsR family transcriptional regulator